MWPVAPECGLLLLNVDSLVTGVCGQLVHVWVVVTFELWGKRALCIYQCVLPGHTQVPFPFWLRNGNTDWYEATSRLSYTIVSQTWVPVIE